MKVKEEEFWGWCTDNDQKFVEMAPIAFALMALPELFFDPLSDREKGNVQRWLYQINDHAMPRCNWYYFRVIVNACLRKLGLKYSSSKLEEDLGFIESCYIDEGWYFDGVSGRKDYDLYMTQYAGIET